LIERTLGSHGAKLLKGLREFNKRTFGIKDAINILNSRYGAIVWLLNDLERKGWLFRLKKGKYIVVPQDMEKGFPVDWFVIARELVDIDEYYLFGYSALVLQNMITHPVMTVFIASPSRYRSRQILDVKFKFISIARDKIWGVEEKWITEQDKVKVSDLERTVLDCLAFPKYAGGVTEVWQGVLRRKKDFDYAKFYRYIENFGNFAVGRRFGYLAESSGLDMGGLLPKFQKLAENTKGYSLLDPSLSDEGKYFAKWGLRINIPPEDLKGIMRIR